MTTVVRRGQRSGTARELAGRFGVSERTIRYLMAEERAAYEGRAETRRERIIELHRQGATGTGIAQQLGVTPGLVYKRLREAREAGVDLTLFPREESA